MMIAPYIGNDKLADDNTDGNTGHLICHLAVDMNGRIGRSLDCHQNCHCHQEPQLYCHLEVHLGHHMDYHLGCNRDCHLICYLVNHLDSGCHL